MKIKDHKLIAESGDKVEFKETPNHSGEFGEGLPDTIVIHYTAGGSLDSSVNWLINPDAKASAHLVIAKDGKVVQLAPFNIKTWHAGISRWKNRKNLNHYSIGIELDNAGLLEKRADGYYTHFDKKIDNARVVLARHKNQQEEKAWEAFTEKQIERVEVICQLLAKEYSVKELVGHDDIAPGRKTDPGPAFPLNTIRDKILFGRKDDEEADLAGKSGKKGMVTADFLNIRSKPDLGSLKVSDPLPGGTKVRIMDEKDGWYYVNVDLEGWVSSKWVKKPG